MAFRQLKGSAAIGRRSAAGNGNVKMRRLQNNQQPHQQSSMESSLWRSATVGSSSSSSAFISSFIPLQSSPRAIPSNLQPSNLQTSSNQHSRHHYFSSMPMPIPIPSLCATIPTTDETYEYEDGMSFADLDYFKDTDNDVVEEDLQTHEHNNQQYEETVKDIDHNINGHQHQHNSDNNKQDDNNESNKNKVEDSIAVKSKPKKGGTWDPTNPLQWCKSFGSRSPSDDERLATLTNLHSGEEGYHDITNIQVPDVTIVRTKEQALKVLQKLMEDKLANPWRIHSCDTEVMDIDLKKVGPIGHGYVTCLSVYSGPDFDYGLGDSDGDDKEEEGKKGTMLWVDNLDDAHGILQEFKSWLEDETILKVWHNYGFDRHVLYNEGINVKGFGGDTMHMARLSDTSRMKYSLESLTEDLLGQRKVPMKEIFGEARLRKDGTPGAIIDLPPMEKLQRHPKYRHNWIKYSAFDAKSTYNLYRHLENKLEKTPWFATWSLMDYYRDHMRPFGEVLTDLERRGILVATDYLANVEVQARKDRKGHVNTFRQWASKQIGPDGLAMNLASSVQLSTFLFGGAQNAKTKEHSETVRVFKTPRAEVRDDAMDAYRERDERMKEEKAMNNNLEDGNAEMEEDEFDMMKATELKVLCKEYGLKVSGKKAELQQRLRGHFQMLNNPEMASPDNKNNNSVLSAQIDDYESMTVKDLRDACAARGISASGKKKAALIKELRADDSLIREVTAEHMKASPNNNNGNGVDSSIAYRKISELLEEAVATGENDALKIILADIKAKNNAEPKFVDVKITSLGMEPDKFTTSGAPSATADVLRKLGGDPFADPPIYGKVCNNICWYVIQ